MENRTPQNAAVRMRRMREHMNVLKYLLDPETLRSRATGKGCSPEKLVCFFAGYVAMRRIWELKTENGKVEVGDREIDRKKTEEGSIIYRIEKEVCHCLGYDTCTLFKVAKFKYWGKKFLAIAEKK